MYKNIVFDLGGVVVDFNPREFLVDHFLNEKIENKLYDITFGSAEWLKIDAGVMTRAQAYEIIREKGKDLGLSFETEVILSDWFDMLNTKEDVYKRQDLDSRRICSTFCIA